MYHKPFTTTSIIYSDVVATGVYIMHNTIVMGAENRFLLRKKMKNEGAKRGKLKKGVKHLKIASFFG